MFCQKCGKQLSADERFCSSCGAPAPAEEAAPVQPAQPVQPEQQAYYQQQQPVQPEQQTYYQPQQQAYYQQPVQPYGQPVMYAQPKRKTGLIVGLIIGAAVVITGIVLLIVLLGGSGGSGGLNGVYSINSGECYGFFYNDYLVISDGSYNTYSYTKATPSSSDVYAEYTMSGNGGTVNVCKNGDNSYYMLINSDTTNWSMESICDGGKMNSNPIIGVWYSEQYNDWVMFLNDNITISSGSRATYQADGNSLTLNYNGNSTTCQLNLSGDTMTLSYNGNSMSYKRIKP